MLEESRRPSATSVTSWAHDRLRGRSEGVPRTSPGEASTFPGPFDVGVRWVVPAHPRDVEVDGPRGREGLLRVHDPRRGCSMVPRGRRRRIPAPGACPSSEQVHGVAVVAPADGCLLYT